jgi:serine/threonine-protein kinase RsbW
VTGAAHWRAERRFERGLASIASITEFTAQVFACQGVDAALRDRVDLVIEELFTNMVKYSSGGTQVSIGLVGGADAVEVVMLDTGVERFDPTLAPDAETHLPIERREPGGLGLHLVRRLVDSLRYDYDFEARSSRITFSVMRRPP